jgi:hypothetical protein
MEVNMDAKTILGVVLVMFIAGAAAWPVLRNRRK